jgi:hypothetical protein
VPTWHSRQAVSVVQTLYPDADISCVAFYTLLTTSVSRWHSLIEDSGDVHWYDGMLDRPEVHTFLDRVLAKESQMRELRETAVTSGWTMTVANPYESGGLIFLIS